MEVKEDEEVEDLSIITLSLNIIIKYQVLLLRSTASHKIFDKCVWKLSENILQFVFELFLMMVDLDRLFCPFVA